MEIISERVNGATVIKIKGSFDVSEPDIVERFFRQINAAPTLPIVIDLSEVNFIDSVGLAVLVIAWKRCRQQRRPFVLCGVQQNVHVIFEVTLFDKTFPMFNTQAEAIVSLRNQQNVTVVDTLASVGPETQDWLSGVTINNTRADAPLVEAVLHADRKEVQNVAKGWLSAGYRAFGIWGKELIACWPESARDELEHAKESDITLSSPIKVGAQVIGRGVLLGGVKTAMSQALLEADTHLVSEMLTMKVNFQQATRELVAQERLRTEVDVAARIQLQLLPKYLPHVGGLDIYTYSCPAQEVGGDFYDFVSDADDSFTFIVGDVSGKGLPAALLMGMTHTAFHIAVRSLSVVDPQTVVRRLSEYLYNDFTEVGMFVTVFVCRYDNNSGQLIYANAGHSPIVYCPRGDRATLLQADSPALGILPTSSCENQVLPFHAGDVLLAGTDGLNESINATGELFGYRRLLKAVEALAHLPSSQMGTELLNTILQFAHGCKQADDQTCVLLKGTALSLRDAIA